jgi:hypothetical protein
MISSTKHSDTAQKKKIASGNSLDITSVAAGIEPGNHTSWFVLLPDRRGALFAVEYGTGS